MLLVCKGRVSAFCGSLYQQRICWSTDKSLFGPPLTYITLCNVNKHEIERKD